MTKLWTGFTQRDGAHLIRAHSAVSRPARPGLASPAGPVTASRPSGGPGLPWWPGSTACVAPGQTQHSPPAARLPPIACRNPWLIGQPR